MVVLTIPERSGVERGERLGAKPSLDADQSRILGEAILSERRPAPILRLAVIPFEGLGEVDGAASLLRISRRCGEHLRRAANEWVRRGGAPALLASAITALRHEVGCFSAQVALEEAHDPALLLIGALRLERTLIGIARQSAEARAFIQTLDQELETLERVYPATPLTELDHAQAVRIAREALIHAHLCIPVQWARRTLRFGRAPYDDLVQAGNEGLVQAADAYDWRYGAPFSAYVYPWVKIKVSRVERQDDLVLLPHRLHAARGRVRRALAQSGAADLAERALRVGLRPHALEAIEASAHHASLDADASFVQIPDDAPQPAELAERRERTALLMSALSLCGVQEREVLRRHYGIGCGRLSMRELAGVLQLSTQRLYQLKKAGLEQLQAADARALLRDYAA